MYRHTFHVPTRTSSSLEELPSRSLTAALRFGSSAAPRPAEAACLAAYARSQSSSTSSLSRSATTTSRWPPEAGLGAPGRPSQRLGEHRTTLSTRAARAASNFPRYSRARPTVAFDAWPSKSSSALVGSDVFACGNVLPVVRVAVPRSENSHAIRLPAVESLPNARSPADGLSK